MIRPLIKLTVVEIKLLLREPVTVVFTLALPLMILYVLGGVFGNDVDPTGEVVYRGFGPTDFYTPAYVALSVAGVALIGVPAHLAEYRESGVLRRFQASGVPRTVVLASQLLVTLLIATSGVVLLIGAALLLTEVERPESLPLFVLAYLLGATGVAALGLLLGTLLPTARAAQTVGLLLWFMFMFLSGAGPPPEVLPTALRNIGAWLPLTPIVELMQEPWLTGRWATTESVLAALMIVLGGIGARSAFRWL